MKRKVLALAVMALVVAWPVIVMADTITQVLKEYELSVTGTATTYSFSSLTGITRTVNGTDLWNRDATDSIWITFPVPGTTVGPNPLPAVASDATKNQLLLVAGAHYRWDFGTFDKFNVIAGGNGAKLRLTSVCPAN